LDEYVWIHEQHWQLTEAYRYVPKHRKYHYTPQKRERKQHRGQIRHTLKKNVALSAP
jgi:hypothetical protein